MAFTAITVTRRYLTAEFTPAKGTVRMKPTAPMVNGDTVVAASRVGTLDAEGDLTLVVAANNDPTTTPPGVSYEVREDLDGQATRTYFVTIPYNAVAGTVALSTLNVAAVPPVVTYPAPGPPGPNKIATAADLTTTGAAVGQVVAAKTVSGGAPSAFGLVGSQVLNVKLFGAVGDGTTDDTAAFQACVDHLLARGGGTLYAPTGIYRIAGTIYVNKSDQATAFGFVGDQVYNNTDSATAYGTILRKTNAGDIIRLNIGTDGYPYSADATKYSFSNVFRGFGMEGTDSATTYGIRMYRSRASFIGIAGRYLDGLIMQDDTPPAGFVGTWNNYCDQCVYDDIRMFRMKTYGLYLTLNDASVLSRITYSYPAASAQYGIRIHYSMGFTIDGLLYSDANHLATAPVAFMRATACKGFRVTGVHIEESDFPAFFSFDQCYSAYVGQIHERFRGKTLVKLTGCKGIDLFDANLWATRDGGFYDLDVTTSTDVSHRGWTPTTFNASDATITRALSVNDPSSAVSDLVRRADVYAAARLAWRSGRYYAPAVGLGSAGAQTQDQIRWVPVVVPSAVTVSELSCLVTVAGSAGAAVRLAIAAPATDGRPGSVVYASGALDCTSTGKKSVTGLSVALTPGLYHFGAAVQNSVTAGTALTTGPSFTLFSAYNPLMAEQQDNSGTISPCYSELGVTGAISAVGALSLGAGSAIRVQALVA